GRLGAGKVDRTDARMRGRAAHEHRMQHAGQRQVGDVEALAGEQALILAPLERTPHERSAGFFCRLSCRHRACSPGEMQASKQGSDVDTRAASLPAPRLRSLRELRTGWSTSKRG